MGRCFCGKLLIESSCPTNSVGGISESRLLPERQDCGDFAINLKAEVSRKLQLDTVGMVID